jgi:hypothetical protein
MDQVVLDEGRIQAGIELIKRLDSSPLKPTKAFWMFYPDQSVWKLLVGGTKLGGKEIAQQYGLISKILSEMSRENNVLSFDDIKIIQPRDKVADALGAVFRVGGLSTVRASRNMINGIYVDDALIYRLEADSTKQVA